MNTKAQKLQKQITNNFLFKIYKLTKLPSLWFWKVKVKSLNLEECVVTIPLFWGNQNPFKSIYFGALAGAAEFSTGALLKMALTDTEKDSTTLVTHFEMEYTKKAVGKITLKCDEGKLALQTISRLSEDNPIEVIILSSKAYNEDGIHVATAKITWSMKYRPSS